MLFPQPLKDTTMISQVNSGLHMCFSGWRNFSREAWQKKNKYIQFDKDLDDMYSLEHVSSLESIAAPETTAF